MICFLRVSGQARLRGWSSSSSSSPPWGGDQYSYQYVDVFHDSNELHLRVFSCFKTKGVNLKTKTIPHLHLQHHSWVAWLQQQLLYCLGCSYQLEDRRRERENEVREDFYYCEIKNGALIALQEELKLSTGVFSWSLCLGEGSCVKKQNMAVFSSKLILTKCNSVSHRGPFVPIQLIEEFFERPDSQIN